MHCLPASPPHARTHLTMSTVLLFQAGPSNSIRPPAPLDAWTTHCVASPARRAATCCSACATTPTSSQQAGPRAVQRVRSWPWGEGGRAGEGEGGGTRERSSACWGSCGPGWHFADLVDLPCSHLIEEYLIEEG